MKKIINQKNQPINTLFRQLDNNRLKTSFKNKKGIKKKRTRSEIRKKVLLKKSREIRYKAISDTYEDINDRYSFIKSPLIENLTFLTFSRVISQKKEEYFNDILLKQKKFRINSIYNKKWWCRGSLSLLKVLGERSHTPMRNDFYISHYQKNSYKIWSFRRKPPFTIEERIRVKKAKEAAKLIWENVVLKNPRFFLKVYPRRRESKLREMNKSNLWHKNAKLMFRSNSIVRKNYKKWVEKRMHYSVWNYLSFKKNILYYLLRNRNKNICKMIHKFRENWNFCQNLKRKYYIRWRGRRLFRRRRKFALYWKRRFLLNSNVETNKQILAHAIISKEFFTSQKFMQLKPYMFTLKINKFIKHFIN